jgi:hypothetical protein
MRTLRPLSWLLTLTASCAGMQKAYDDQLDRAVVLSAGVDQHAYTRVALDPFVCAAPDGLCDDEWNARAMNQFQLALSRVGYVLFDQTTYAQWLIAPPVATTGVYVAGAGMQVEASADGMSASVQVTPVVTAVVTPVVVFDQLSVDARAVIVERADLDAIATGRLTLGAVDDVTGWREVHVTLRLADARSGAVLWQAEWREQANEGREAASVAEAVDQALQVLTQALERKAPRR